MSRSCFVVPDSVTLPLFDDGALWIKVKKQLNAGEMRQLAQSAFSRVSPAGTPEAPTVAFELNLESGAFAKMLLYLEDWNLTDASGKTVAIDTPKAKRDAVKALDQDVAQEIERVIDVHVEAVSQEKKQKTGPPAPDTTS